MDESRLWGEERNGPEDSRIKRQRMADVWEGLLAQRKVRKPVLASQ